MDDEDILNWIWTPTHVTSTWHHLRDECSPGFFTALLVLCEFRLLNVAISIPSKPAYVTNWHYQIAKVQCQGGSHSNLVPFFLQLTLTIRWFQLQIRTWAWGWDYHFMSVWLFPPMNKGSGKCCFTLATVKIELVSYTVLPTTMSYLQAVDLI